MDGVWLMSLRACPLCQSRNAAPYRKVGQAEIVRCRSCGFLFRPALPNDLSGMYGEDYYRSKGKEEAQWAGSGDYIADKDRLLRTFDEHIGDLERLHAPGRLLDIGCAAGFLLEAARRRGWQVTGIDISDYAARYARETFHLDVRIGSVEQLVFPEGAFDAITAFEYIEHVPDPVATLKAVRPWLSRQGVLVLTTPNAGGWQAKHDPEQFDGFREWRHLTYFSRQTMKRLLAMTGFAPIEIRTDLSIVTRQTLGQLGVKEPERWRSLVNRAAPGLKTALRRAMGNLCGGSSMKVYAKPVS